MQNDCQGIQTWTPWSILCIVRRVAFEEVLSESLLGCLNTCGSSLKWIGRSQTQILELGVDPEAYLAALCKQCFVAQVFTPSGRKTCLFNALMFMGYSFVTPLTPGALALICAWKKKACSAFCCRHSGFV